MVTAAPPEPDVYRADCPTRQVLALIGDKWSALVIGRLTEGGHRYGALRRTIGGISPKMLAQTLRLLERDGLVARRVYPTVPPRVDYALTPLGRSLAVHLLALQGWAEANINAVIAARADYAARPEPQPLG